MEEAYLVFGLQKGYIHGKDRKGAEHIRNNIFPRAKSFLRDKSAERVYFCSFRNREGSPFQKFKNWEGMTEEDEIETIEEMREFLSRDNVFYYSTESALSSEELSEKIEDAERVYLLDADTDASILATAFDAFGRGIEPFVIEDLSYSRAGKDNHEAALKILRRIIGEERVVKSVEIL